MMENTQTCDKGHKFLPSEKWDDLCPYCMWETKSDYVDDLMDHVKACLLFAANYPLLSPAEREEIAETLSYGMAFECVQAGLEKDRKEALGKLPKTFDINAGYAAGAFQDLLPYREKSLLEDAEINISCVLDKVRELKKAYCE